MDYDGHIVWPVVGLTTISCALFNRLLKSGRLLHQPQHTTASSMDQNRFLWTWRNTVVSFIHSLVTSIWAVASFAQAPMLMRDMINVSSVSARLLIAFSTGYFLYDLIDMVFNDAKRHIELLLHHGVVLTAFSLCLATQQYAGWATCSLLMEINSTFLHARRFLKMTNRDTFPLANVVGVFQLMTFISCRLVTSAWMVKWLTVNRHIIPLPHFLVAAIGMAVMVPMNMVLLFRLAKADMRKNSVDGKKLS